MTVLDTGYDRWREEMSSTFAGLVPEPSAVGPTVGHICGAAFGDVRTFRVSGSPQTIRRTHGAVRHQPSDALKVCLQLRGRATLHQGSRELVIGPGQLVVYDTARTYDLRLAGEWECAVMVFPPAALQLPHRWIDGVMQYVHDASAGPGKVLASFIDASLGHGAPRRDQTCAGLRFADAGLQLLSSALTATGLRAGGDNVNQVLRLAVLDYVRRHLHDIDLSHRSVAAAHGMSTRTLDRLFETEPTSITATIRDFRLDGSRRDLLDPRTAHVSVGAIAARWCFFDPAHFSRLYKRKFEISPSVERAELIRRN